MVVSAVPKHTHGTLTHSLLSKQPSSVDPPVTLIWRLTEIPKNSLKREKRIQSSQNEEMETSEEEVLYIQLALTFSSRTLLQEWPLLFIQLKIFLPKI